MLWSQMRIIYTIVHPPPQSYNLSVHVNVTSGGYFGENSTLERRMADFHRDVVRLSSSLYFGRPHSQEKLNTYLGER
jgi:hypothetical protein